MSVSMGPEPGPGEVRLEITSYMHRLLARVAVSAGMTPIEDCFWHGVSDGWDIFRLHHQTTPWVRLPEMHEPELVRIVCCGGSIVRYPDNFVAALGEDVATGVVGFTGGIDATTEQAAIKAARHWRCGETDANNALLALGLAARLSQQLGGESYLRSDKTGQLVPIDLPPLLG